MYVCPQMTNIYSSTSLGFRIHFSMRQPCFNKHSFNHTHTLILCQTHTRTLCYIQCARIHIHGAETHTQEAKKKNMRTCAKYRPQACKKKKKKEKRCSQTALPFSRSMGDAELCMQTKMQVYARMPKHQQIQIPDNIPGH